MLLVVGVIVFALAFEYINGFHDTANAIATVVSTRVLSPRQAIFLAAICNLVGALWGTAVATTIGSELVKTEAVNLQALLSALLAAVFWNLLTWWFGLPSSSSHALIGGLCGATVAAAGWNVAVINWGPPCESGPGILGAFAWLAHEVFAFFRGAEGLLPKVIVPMVVSPILGLALGFIVMGLLLVLLRKWRPHRVNVVFGRLQLISASLMGLSHGTNDAQKTMGILALTLFTATTTGVFADLPGWLGFLRAPEFRVPFWVKVICSITMAMGTAAGGWRIIRTLGHRMVKLQPIHGFAAETTAATVINVATHFGIPLSTTHIISSSIMGVGATRRLSAVKWSVVGRMVWAWILTLPATALIGALLQRLLM